MSIEFVLAVSLRSGVLHSAIALVERALSSSLSSLCMNSVLALTFVSIGTFATMLERDTWAQSSQVLIGIFFLTEKSISFPDT
jgi:hypothetical protein